MNWHTTRGSEICQILDIFRKTLMIEEMYKEMQSVSTKNAAYNTTVGVLKRPLTTSGENDR